METAGVGTLEYRAQLGIDKYQLATKPQFLNLNQRYTFCFVDHDKCFNEKQLKDKLKATIGRESTAILRHTTAILLLFPSPGNACPRALRCFVLHLILSSLPFVLPGNAVLLFYSKAIVTVQFVYKQIHPQSFVILLINSCTL